jgi:transcriptional regulator with XRE-family HTH domain
VEHQLYVQLGKLVRAKRDQADLTQGQLAERIGLTRTSISNIENGRQKIQLHTLYALATALGVPVEILLPPVDVYQSEALEERLPNNLIPEEREWVKRVLTTTNVTPEER